MDAGSGAGAENAPTTAQIAAFFDCENVGSAATIDFVICDLATRGRLLIKKAYGDFMLETLASWRDRCNGAGVEMIQKSVFGGKTGKNAADMALTIDAMEMLVTRKNISVFVLVTSDGDFSPLAGRLREHGKHVIVFGASRCSRQLQRTCDEFVVLERSRDQAPEKGARFRAPRSASRSSGQVGGPPRPADAGGKTYGEAAATSHAGVADIKMAKRETVKALRHFEEKGYCDAAGWVHNDRLLAYLKRLHPDWLSQLSSLGLRWRTFLEVSNAKRIECAHPSKPQLFVRVRRRAEDGAPASRKRTIAEGSTAAPPPAKQHKTARESETRGEGALEQRRRRKRMKRQVGKERRASL